MSHKSSAHQPHHHAPPATDAEQADAAAPAPPAGEANLGSNQVTLAAAEYEELKGRAAKAEDHWNRLLRTTADFDNFKKRAVRERQDAVQYANESLMESLLPVLDTFEMAMAAAAGATEGPAKALFDGVGMVRKQLSEVLTQAGLEEVDASGKVFDPQVHQALSQLESATIPEGHVLHQTRKGYKLRGRLLRPANVVVAKAPASAGPA